MANRFSFEVVALDKFTAIFRNLNNQASKSIRPAIQAQRSLAAAGREMHLDKITKGLRGMSAAGQKVAASLGLASGPMEAIFGLGAAGGIVAAGAAVVAIGAKWGQAGFEINRTATAIGVSTNDLQEFRGVAKLAGLDVNAATTSLANMGKTMQDAEFGRNDDAFQVLNKFGIGIKRNKDGVVDMVETMKSLADVLQVNTNPQVRALLANTLGIGEMLPVLIKGRAGFEEYAKQARAAGYVMGPEAIAQAEAYAKALGRLEVAGDALSRTWGSKLVPMLTRAIDALMNMSTTHSGGFLDFMRRLDEGSGLKDTDGGVVLSKRTAAFAASAGPADAGGPLPRGMRSHNPGNLMNPGGAGFQSFADDQSGLNAMAGQISRYGNRDGLRSISAIIGKYASGAYPGNSPATEAGYIKDVSAQTGFDANAQLNTNDPKVLAPLLSAMVKHEQGKQTMGAEQYAQAAQSIKVEVAFANAPPGTQAKATSDGAHVPARVSHALSMDTL